MAVSVLGSETLSQSTNAATHSITVPSGTDMIVAAISLGGYNYTSNDKLAAFNLDGAGQDGVQVAFAHAEAADRPRTIVYYMLSPATGSQTLTLNLDPDGEFWDGITTILLYLDGVDTSDPLGDSTDVDQGAGSTPTDTQALTGVAAEDLAIIAVSQTESNTLPNAAPSGSGQTQVQHSYNDMYLSVGYEVGESTLSLASLDSDAAWVALAINGTAGGGGTTVSVSALDHTHTLDTVSITQSQNIGVADSYHAHALDTVAIQQINNIEIASMFHAGELDTVTLTQTHSIGIGDLFHAHVLDDTGITQRHNISVDGLLHTHELDTVAVQIGDVLTAIADDLFHAHVLDSVGVTQRQNVTVADMYHGHVVDGASLSPRITVSIDDLYHAHEIDGVDYTQAHLIVVDDLTHEQSQGTVSLTQRHFLTIQDLAQAHNLDVVNFTLANGKVSVTFSSKQGGVAFAGKIAGGVAFAGKIAGAAMTGN